MVSTSNSMAVGNAMPVSMSHDEIFTRLTEKGPFYPPRVNTILDTVQIGAISPDESIKVRALLRKFADIFALLVKEVKPISTTKY